MTFFSRWLERVWYGRHAPVILRPLSWLYRLVAQRRRADFLSGRKSSYRPPVPVIVVGNITVGGTGKTPMIVWLIRYCQAQELKVGVVSRGYGARPPLLPWRVKPEQSADEAGDEPLMIVQRTGVPMMIDPDRSRAVAALLTQEPLDLVLSDDGMQHYALARDLELVLIDHSRGLGNGYCLPAGPLREPSDRLASVDAVLCNGASEDSTECYGLRLRPCSLINLSTGESRPLDQFAGQRVHAVAGIGHPQRFFDTLQALDFDFIAHAFADHAVYTAQSLHFEPSLPVVMTEKDAVKCRSLASSDWWYLKVDAQPSDAFVAWLEKRLPSLIQPAEKV